MYYLYTIGHSTHPMEKFIKMLKKYSITAVCDVRSNPYSKFNPQYNRETIQKELKNHNIAYVFLGKELGPRSDDETCYINGKVQYDLIAKTDLFLQGISRLKQGMKSYRIALMCAEKDPITCHRNILICRQLRAKDISIYHIMEDESLENNCDSERRMMKMLKIPEVQLFESPEELVQRAYHIQGEKIAFQVTAENNDKSASEK
jgi:uncharacterized protein (DUF488 family)